eukprot:TRINITY_DN12470_c0_g1_i1.p1 TRINITY_DN12470_c0_g1~~TRINITY_DN12470_c0_g1_i1.p1  ORF type:complete len:387 (-),score=75.59 TRINITY_DN12470_c0_g1_i1:201-1361(-)
MLRSLVGSEMCIRDSLGGGGQGSAYVTLEIAYTGLPTLSGAQDTARFATHSVIRCPVNTSGSTVPESYPDRGVIGPTYPLDASVLVGLRVTFESAGPPPAALDPTVDAGTYISAVGSLVSGMPSSLVRGGMVSSLRSMLRCSEFDPTDEIDTINNPPMWALGGEVLQHQRGSVAIAACILLLAAIGAVISVVSVTCGGGASTLTEATMVARLPSMALPLMLLVSEISTGSVATLLMYHPKGGEDNDEGGRSGGQLGVDVVMCICVGGTTWAYMIYYAYSTTLGCRVVPVAAAAPLLHHHRPPSSSPLLQDVELDTDDDDSDIGSDASDADDDVPDNRHIDKPLSSAAPPARGWRRVLAYLIEPTHEPAAALHEKRWGAEDLSLIHI